MRYEAIRTTADSGFIYDFENHLQMPYGPYFTYQTALHRRDYTHADASSVVECLNERQQCYWRQGMARCSHPSGCTNTAREGSNYCGKCGG